MGRQIRQIMHRFRLSGLFLGAVSVGHASQSQTTRGCVEGDDGDDSGDIMIFKFESVILSLSDFFLARLD